MIFKAALREFLPILLLFIIVNTIVLVLGHLFLLHNINQEVIIAGNLLLFIITAVSFWIAKKGLWSKNPHAFTRSVYGSIMVKMFLCMIVAFVYIFINRKQIDKAALFICMGLYLVYTFLEVTVLTRLLRQKPNE